MKKFLHNIRVLKRKIKLNKNYQYRIRYVMILSILFIIIFFSILGFRNTFGLYESNTKISPNIKTALFVTEPGIFKSTIPIVDIVPSESPYVYSFTVSNYNDEKVSDVDLNYDLKLVTTTNIPLEYKIYRNQDYQSGEDIIKSREIKQDSDLAWYNYFVSKDSYNLLHNEETTDIFSILVYFPISYRNDTTYTEMIENVEIVVEAKQVIEGE